MRGCTNLGQEGTESGRTREKGARRREANRRGKPGGGGAEEGTERRRGRGLGGGGRYTPFGLGGDGEGREPGELGAEGARTIRVGARRGRRAGLSRALPTSSPSSRGFQAANKGSSGGRALRAQVRPPRPGQGGQRPEGHCPAPRPTAPPTPSGSPPGPPEPRPRAPAALTGWRSAAPRRARPPAADACSARWCGSTGSGSDSRRPASGLPWPAPPSRSRARAPGGSDARGPRGARPWPWARDARTQEDQEGPARPCGLRTAPARAAHVPAVRWGRGAPAVHMRAAPPSAPSPRAGAGRDLGPRVKLLRPRPC